MRNKVLAAIDAYAEGGPITKAIAGAKLTNKSFYRMLHTDHDLMVVYEDVQKARSYMMLDEAYEIGSDKDQDPRSARVMADIRMKLAGMLHPDRFGDRVNHTIEAKPNLITAIESGRSRAALPSRDLMPVIDVQAVDITPLLPASAPDMQSEEGEIDPFS